MSFLSELFSPHSILSGGITTINDSLLKAAHMDNTSTLGAVNDALKNGPIETSISQGKPASASSLWADRNERLGKDKSGNARKIGDIAAIVGLAYGGAAAAGAMGGGSAAGATGTGLTTGGASSAAGMGVGSGLTASTGGAGYTLGSGTASASGMTGGGLTASAGTGAGYGLTDAAAYSQAWNEAPETSWKDHIPKSSQSNSKDGKANSAQLQQLQARATQLRSQIAALQK